MNEEEKPFNQRVINRFLNNDGDGIFPSYDLLDDKEPADRMIKETIDAIINWSQAVRDYNARPLPPLIIPSGPQGEKLRELCLRKSKGPETPE